MNTYNSLEAGLLLGMLAQKRAAKLNAIATEMLLNGNAPTYEASPVYISKIQHDNVVTDREIERYFSQGILANYPQEREVHFNRCENSGVQECVCFANQSRGEQLPF